MAQNNRRAGALRDYLDFQRRGDLDNGWGDTTPGAGDWETVFSAYAAMRPLRGSEAVMADRLGGVQPYVVTIRQHDAALQVTTAWRVVDARTGRSFAIVSPLADPDGRNAWLEFLVREGVVE